MKTLIICFSQTGNTWKIAEFIKNGVADVTGQCDLKPLDDAVLDVLSDYDLVGLGAPVYYYREPFNVRDFINALPGLNGQHWFVFCTHGNVIGNFFPSVTGQLEQKDARVVGFHNSYASIFVPFYPRPSYTSGHPDSVDLEQASEFGRRVAENEAEYKSADANPVGYPYPISSEAWLNEGQRMTQEMLAEALPGLTINLDTCNQCHQCEDNCPVQGIDINADPPRIQDPCIFCWQCVNTCPTLSINADWSMLVSRAPEYYARYKTELDLAAERGEFRWLVNPAYIDVDDPFYRQRERELRAIGKDQET